MREQERKGDRSWKRMECELGEKRAGTRGKGLGTERKGDKIGR